MCICHRIPIIYIVGYLQALKNDGITKKEIWKHVVREQLTANSLINTVINENNCVLLLHACRCEKCFQRWNKYNIYL
jgi:hypothetical protein